MLDFNSQKTNNALFKLLAIACLVLYVGAIITVRNSPATGYEASIYTSTPLIYWISVALNAICGIGIIVREAYNGQYGKGNFWLVGFALLFLAFISLVVLWILRGYAYWGNYDPLTHIGWTKYLLTNLATNPNDFYPITHIYLAQWHYVLNVDIAEIAKYLVLLFNLVYLSFVFLLARLIMSSKAGIIGGVVFILLAGSAFFSDALYFVPNVLADLFLPFAVYLFARSSESGSYSWRILFFLVLLIYPPFHPVPSLALLLMMVTVSVPAVFQAILRRQSIRSNVGIFTFRPLELLFLIGWSVWWFYHTRVLIGTLEELQQYLSGVGINNLMTLNQQIQHAQQYQYDVLALFLKVYGALVATVIISLTLLPMLVRKHSNQIEHKTLLSLYAPVAAIMLTMVPLYLVNISFSPARLLWYVLFFSGILAGAALYKLIAQARAVYGNAVIGKVVAAFVFVLFVGAFASSALQLYPSKYILVQNDQVTRTDLQGMKWFFASRDQNFELSTIGIYPLRFADFLLDTKTRDSQINLQSVVLDPQNALNLPWHFGYDQRSELKDWYTQDAYLLLDQADKALYQQVYPELQNIRFTPADFAKLDQDPSLSKLYSNGGLTVYYVTF
jgi:hypothetical protein